MTSGNDTLVDDVLHVGVFSPIFRPTLVARNGYHQDTHTQAPIEAKRSKPLLLLIANDDSPFDAVAQSVYA